MVSLNKCSRLVWITVIGSILIITAECLMTWERVIYVSSKNGARQINEFLTMSFWAGRERSLLVKASVTDTAYSRFLSEANEPIHHKADEWRLMGRLLYTPILRWDFAKPSIAPANFFPVFSSDEEKLLQFLLVYENSLPTLRKDLVRFF